MKQIGLHRDLHGFFSSEKSCYAFLFTGYSTETCSLLCNKRQLFQQQAVLPLMDFHRVEQVFFFVCQQNTESVNLIERDKFAIIPLQNL